jgi:hypothetical protein
VVFDTKDLAPRKFDRVAEQFTNEKRRKGRSFQCLRNYKVYTNEAMTQP